jgi:hypothetical protein
VAWRNARWSDGQGTTSVDLMPASSGQSEGNGSSTRSTEGDDVGGLDAHHSGAINLPSTKLSVLS